MAVKQRNNIFKYLYLGPSHTDKRSSPCVPSYVSRKVHCRKGKWYFPILVFIKFDVMCASLPLGPREPLSSRDNGGFPK